MHIARKLTLLAMLAIAATVLAAPSAFAQIEPLLHNQTPRLLADQEIHAADDTACDAVVPTPPVAVSPLVTSGGCRVHVVSDGPIVFTVHLSAGGMELPLTTCNIEFDLRIDNQAEGWFSHHEFTGANCSRKACGQPNPPLGEGRAYSFFMQEVEPPARTEQAVALFCLEMLGGGGMTHCEVTLPLTQSSTHRYRMAAAESPGHGAIFPKCEIGGTFDFEAAAGMSGEFQAYQNVEIRHR